MQSDINGTVHKHPMTITVMCSKLTFAAQKRFFKNKFLKI